MALAGLLYQSVILRKRYGSSQLLIHLQQRINRCAVAASCCSNNAVILSTYFIDNITTYYYAFKGDGTNKFFKGNAPFARPLPLSYGPAHDVLEPVCYGLEGVIV